MMYLLEFFVVGLMLAFVSVASNPSPYFGAGGLVVAAGFGCGLMVMLGGSFVSLVLLLVYLGGMLVVFAYSVALASDPYPESWGSVWGYFSVYLILVIVLVMSLGEEGFVSFGLNGADSCGLSVVRLDLSGVPLLFSLGGFGLLICGWVLLLTLFVILELTRGLVRGSLRMV
uniref:NADH-ubiquinone oxidoreductase chain 6 n=1 Tax=Takydromus wolteri TaxID=235402 RepID=J9QDM1_9SAUR|nr:NADH dehydrogenase subunit 6 [Takydromus wolteri]AFN87676.1 NADH dehydrogenase subunit 6 [Takydromus wolteri]